MTVIAPPKRASKRSKRRRGPVMQLIVTWQHPFTRATQPVGLLQQDSEGYEFRYLRRAAEVPDFRPLLGFPELSRTYRSPELFPLFAQRSLDPTRPDFERYVTGLRLDVSASPWEQIVRSGGDKESDTLRVAPAPIFSEGSWHCLTPIIGMRYVRDKTVVVGGTAYGPLSPKLFDEYMSKLSSGDRLYLAPEPHNDYSSSAILVATSTGLPFGYLPDWLAQMLVPLVLRAQPTVTLDEIECHDGKWFAQAIIDLGPALSEEYDFLSGSTWRTFDA